MKDFEKKLKPNNLIIASIAKRKVKRPDSFSIQSLRPMRSCLKNPSFRPRIITKTEIVQE